jgi:TRAP-type C4-dicarboxylate transport system permease small subunit
MTLFIATVRRLSQLCGIVSVLLLLAAVFAVCHLVFVRYLLRESAIWQHEFVTFALIAATFIGSPYVLLRRGHVNVDLLPLYLGPRARLALALFASAVALAFCLVAAWTGIGWWHEAWAKGWRNETVWAPPLWIPRLSLPIGMTLISLQYVADILSLATGRDPPFGITNEDATKEALPNEGRP